MVRRKIKWKFALFLYLVLLSVFIETLPIGINLPSLTTTDTIFKNLEVPVIQNDAATVNDEEPKNNDTKSQEFQNIDVQQAQVNMTRNSLLRDFRPGQEIQQYTVELTINGNSFDGRVLVDVRLTRDTREDAILLYIEDLEVTSVSAAIGNNLDTLTDAGYNVDDGVLEIEPAQEASSYTVEIKYTGSLDNSGSGLFLGNYYGNTYIAMNLHPTNARRVFPCVDEPTAVATTSFTFKNLNYRTVILNSKLEENTEYEFTALQLPNHLWGMVAHNFENVYNPTTDVLLYGRSGTSLQESLATIAINHFFNALNEWTDKLYTEIDLNQDGRMVVLALPDVSYDWYSLSTVGIWEPYLFMENSHSVKQRSVGLVKIAEAIARQWFGYVVYPENWRYQWVITGLGNYAAWEILKDFQDGNNNEDISLLDVNTLFLTEVIQESLLRDAYTTSENMEPDWDLLEENEIRYHINGLLKYKAPAILRMLRLILGDANTDFIQAASRSLLNSRSLQAVNSLDFYDSINTVFSGNDLVDDIEEYMEQWLTTTGYPILTVSLRQGGVYITQERFAFSSVAQERYLVPITYTTSVNPNFGTDNLFTNIMIDNTYILEVSLGEDDWILLNIQGQGYYRVNYFEELWDRIIEALEDPERREKIHPMNRATLLDDALNLARGNRLSYETALRVVLTMEHETEYAVWKAFVRNMDFLRKRLTGYVFDDEDLDPDIYLRMVRRTIRAFENEIGFNPDRLVSEPAMVSLTRGLVMDHACRSNYQPCIAAAVDLFYDTNSSRINPDIPKDIRPAVYCTMVREGDGDVIRALRDQLDLEPTLYERVVILESLACSQDGNFIDELLADTIAGNSPYMVEERSRIFKAVVDSSYENALRALDFMSLRSNEIRERYGGPQKLEELIFHLAENMADEDHITEFRNWVNNNGNNLEESQDAADKALSLVLENQRWDNQHRDFVYEWIDENDSTTFTISFILLCITLVITFFNH